MTNDSSPDPGQRFTKQQLVDTLRKMGQHDTADQAMRDLPDHAGIADLETFCERHGVFMDDVISWRGGSP